MGGSSTKSKTTQEIPEYVEDAFKNQLSKAADISEQGYVPYQGADTAGFTPQQVNAMQQSANWSSAFGGAGAQPIDVAATLPPQQQFSDGTTGYSSYNGYLENLAHFKEKYPGQYRYIQSFAVDPLTGKQFSGDRGGGNYGESSNKYKSSSKSSKGWEDWTEDWKNSIKKSKYEDSYSDWYSDKNKGDISFDDWLVNNPIKTVSSSNFNWEDLWKI